MALVKWSPWGGLDTLKREIDRLFESHLPELFPGGDAGTRWMPRVDVHEMDNAFLIEADLPGMSIEDIDVYLEGNTLVIAGERKGVTTAEGEYTHVERPMGRFYRSLTLPAPVQAENVDAKYHNGVLSVTVPKAEEARTKHIAIQAA